MGSKHLAIMAISGSALAVGLLTNTFIIAVDFAGWLKGSRANPTDKMITCLAISRVFLLCMSTIDVILFLQNTALETVLKFIDILELSLNYINIWLSTLLSVFYCLKVANYRYSFFLRLKVEASRRVNHLIVASTLISLIFALLPVATKKIAGLLVGNATCCLPQTKSLQAKLLEMNMVFFGIGNGVPFLACSTSSVLLLASLFHHVKLMRRGDNGLAANLGTYYSAIRTLLLSFLIYVFHIGSSIVVAYYTFSLPVVWMHIWLNLSPTLHTSYLIYRTPKLKQELLRLLQHGTDCLFHWRKTRRDMTS